jgi:hypothetical protein
MAQEAVKSLSGNFLLYYQMAKIGSEFACFQHFFRCDENKDVKPQLRTKFLIERLLATVLQHETGATWSSSKPPSAPATVRMGCSQVRALLSRPRPIV